MRAASLAPSTPPPPPPSIPTLRTLASRALTWSRPRRRSLKFNSFFMMPFNDKLPRYMRQELALLERDHGSFEELPASERQQQRIDGLKARVDALAHEKDHLQKIGARLRKNQGIRTASGLPGMRLRKPAAARWQLTRAVALAHGRRPLTSVAPSPLARVLTRAAGCSLGPACRVGSIGGPLF